jgi:hypothetical protein
MYISISFTVEVLIIALVADPVAKTVDNIRVIKSNSERWAEHLASAADKTCIGLQDPSVRPDGEWRYVTVKWSVRLLSTREFPYLSLFPGTSFLSFVVNFLTLQPNIWIVPSNKKGLLPSTSLQVTTHNHEIFPMMNKKRS